MYLCIYAICLPINTICYFGIFFLNFPYTELFSFKMYIGHTNNNKHP